MRNSIYNYPLNSGYNGVELPEGAKVLTVKVQHGKPCLWVLVDKDEPFVIRRTFTIYGTGSPIKERPGTYIGTFFIDGGTLVFHVFEEETK